MDKTRAYTAYPTDVDDPNVQQSISMKLSLLRHYRSVARKNAVSISRLFRLAIEKGLDEAVKELGGER